MSNEVKWVYASQVTLEDSGASAASDVFLAADDTTLASGNHSDFPLADFVLHADFGGTPTNGAVRLYRRDLNIDGTADAPVPSATYSNTYMGTFTIPASTTAFYSMTEVPLTKDCQFYIENATGQNLSAGWDLKVTPKTYGPTA